MRSSLKRLVASVKKSDLTGWQKVCAFTIVQNYKNRAALIGMIVICLVIMFAGPVLSLTAGSKIGGIIEDIGSCKIENFYIINDTETVFDTEKFKSEYNQYEKVNFTLTDISEEEVLEKFSENSENDVLMHIFEKAYIAEDDEMPRYRMLFYRGKDSAVSSMEMDTLSENARDFFSECRLAGCGMTEEQTELLDAHVSVETIDYSDITEDKKEGRNMAVMMSVIIYAMVVMMIVLVSSQQIAVSLVIEKSSKVIETLLLSVRPLAIIVGKITGTMVVLIINAVTMMICAMISCVITASLTAQKYSEVIMSAMSKVSTSDVDMEIDASAVADISFDPFRIIAGIIIILLTTVLAYVFYAVISGISGASCSSMDDLSSASTFISLSTVAGVYLVMGAAMADIPALTRVAYLFPFSGIYMVPVEFMFGKASFLDVIILWAELIILTVLLFRFAAKIYHVLIYHNGERLKLKNLIEISKSQKGRV